MNEMEKMWVALEAHQPIADKKGYGVAWARMCSERTRIAANAVADATPYVADAADAAYAAYAAVDATDATDAAYVAAANRYAKQAIDYIAKANQGEQA